MHFGTSRAFLEHVATEDTVLLTVPSTTPAKDGLGDDDMAQLDQAEHALSSAILFVPGEDGFVLSRVIDDGFTLELRWLGATTGGRGLDERAVPPARFAFPARLVPHPALALAPSGDLHVTALTVQGALYALWFRPPALFTAHQLQHEQWSAEFLLDGLAGRTPVLLHGVDEHNVIVACADGYALAVQVDLERAPGPRAPRLRTR